MTHPDHAATEKARNEIVDLMRRTFTTHNVGNFDPHEFGNAVAPLVNAMAALSLMEKQDEPSSIGAAARSDD